MNHQLAQHRAKAGNYGKDINMQVTKTTTAVTPSWLTIKLLSEIEPAFTPASIRNLVFLAADRKTSKGEIKGNGLAPHIRRIGAKVLINHAGFLAWIDSQEGGASK
jgi:hypothetical protein